MKAWRLNRVLADAAEAHSYNWGRAQTMALVSEMAIVIRQQGAENTALESELRELTLLAQRRSECQ